MNPNLSIIIPTFNSEKTICKTLESIRGQLFNNFEIIVVDGLSSDSTIEIVKSFGSFVDIVISEKDNGIYDAMNKGIDASSGDWLYFLGSDDKLNSDDVLSLLFEKERDKRISIIYGNIKWSSGKVFKSHFNWFINFRNTLHHQGAFYHKDLFLNNRYISYKILGDYEKNLCFYSNKVIGEYNDLIIAFCGLDGVSKIKSSIQENEEIRLKIKHIKRPLIFLVLLFTFLKNSIRRKYR